MKKCLSFTLKMFSQNESSCFVLLLCFLYFSGRFLTHSEVNPFHIHWIGSEGLILISYKSLFKKILLLYAPTKKTCPFSLIKLAHSHPSPILMGLKKALLLIAACIPLSLHRGYPTNFANTRYLFGIFWTTMYLEFLWRPLHLQTNKKSIFEFIPQLRQQILV